MASPIDYAPPVPMHRRRWWRWGLITIAMVALGVAGKLCGPRAWRRGQLLYWQHQCMTFEMPADHAVITREPGSHADPDPACYDAFSSSLPRWPGGMMGAIVFMHERVSRTGVRRLVVVRSVDGFIASDPKGTAGGSARWTIGFLPEIYSPASPWSKAVDITPPIGLDHFGFGGNVANVQVYAGQVDSADPARFTVRYQSGSQWHLLEGRLNDAGDDVTFTDRPGLPGPTVRPATRE